MAEQREPFMTIIRQGNNITYGGICPDVTGVLADYMGMK